MNLLKIIKKQTKNDYVKIAWSYDVMCVRRWINDDQENFKH